MTTPREHAIKHAGLLVEPMLPIIGKVIEKAMQGVVEEACTMQARITELEDLLTSARAIAERKGEDTHWERFSKRLESVGIGSITPRTFRILPSDLEQPTESVDKPEIRKRVLKIVAEQGGIQVGDIKLKDTLYSLGYDSLDVVELVMALEDEFNMEIAEEDAPRLDTVEKVIAYIQANAPKPRVK